MGETPKVKRQIAILFSGIFLLLTAILIFDAINGDTQWIIDNHYLENKFADLLFIIHLWFTYVFLGALALFLLLLFYKKRK